MGGVRVRPLSKCSREKVAAFDQFALAWGNKGDGAPSEIAEENYERAKDELLKRLLYLEHENHKREVKHLGDIHEFHNRCRACDYRIKCETYEELLRGQFQET